MVPFLLPVDQAEPPRLAQPYPGPSQADSEFPSVHHLCKFYFKETQQHLQIISIGDNFGGGMKREMRGRGRKEGRKEVREVKSHPRPRLLENDLSQVL